MLTLRVDYKQNTSELCEIGKEYDTDKSSQRSNVTNVRHCHPYTLFYDSLFKNRKNDVLEIAELGILDGGSLRMWQKYFANSNIYGFEWNQELINRFKNNFNNERITLANIDVTNAHSIKNAFANVNVMYDLIIEDTTHQFEDQIRVIENSYSYIKPGGILIIEDIFKHYDEKNYINRLSHILHQFQDYYFIELDHVNRNSTGWNNDKLFVLVKGGAEPIFKNPNKITIITPSYRTNNLHMLKDSINFDYVDEWIIVYDGSKIETNPNLFADDKIKEFVHTSKGISGNPQRNYALGMVSNPNTFLYFLDDDNVIHPNLYRLLNIIDKNRFYTFNQTNRLAGNTVRINWIDTAMCLVDYSLCNDTRWVLNEYNADGYYIEECYKKNTNIHVYVNNDLCYYNKLA